MGRIPIPRGLRSASFSLGENEYLVFSYPKVVLARLEGLTPAECETAFLVLWGMSNAEIARIRAVAVRTVANQLACLMRKVGVRSRLELACKLRSQSCSGPSEVDASEPGVRSSNGAS